MRILIVNRGLCDNLGDQAINLAMHDFIKNNYNYDCVFSDFTSTNKQTLKIQQKEEKKYTYYRKLIKKILPLDLIWCIRNINRVKNKVSDSDIIIIGGGQLILSNRFAIALLMWVFLAKKYNKKVLVSCVGVGTKFSFIRKCYIKYALNRVDSISVRDSQAQLVLQADFNIKSVVTGDIVLTTNNSDNVERTLYLLGVTEFSVYNLYNEHLDREEYYNKWIDFVIMSKIPLSDFKLIYTTQNDYYECLYFREYVIKKFNLNLEILNTSTLENLNAIFNKSRLIIAGRMHALIIGLTNGCEVITFPISDKLISFSEILTSNNLKDYRSSISKKQLKMFNSYLLGEIKK